MPIRKLPNTALLLLATTAAMTLAGCGGSATPATDAATAAATAQSAQVEAERTAELAAREADLAKREAELSMNAREREVAQREAELAAKERAAKNSNTKKPVTSSRPAQVATAPPPVAVPADVTIVVPAGTQLSVELTSGLSSKTAVVGETFDARLASDVSIDGRRALTAGSRVTGSVTQVISGSSKIGGIPTLGLRFDGVQAANGRNTAISGTLVQQGKSENLKDGAKIAGGAAAGAIIGHQIKGNDGGKIIGGLLGGAAGALVARKTGAEVDLPAGTVLALVLDAPFEVRSR